MNLIPLAKLNELRFPDHPVPATKLQRWCRDGELPARKIGGEWFVDLDAFDNAPVRKKEDISPAARAVLDRMRAQG